MISQKVRFTLGFPGLGIFVLVFCDRRMEEET